MTAAKKSRLLVVSFVLSFAVLVLAGIGAYRQSLENVEASQWVRHTYEVLGELSATFALLLDIQVGSRGYVITGQEPFLEPFHNAVPQVEQSLRRLRQLTADNPEQQRRFDALESLTRQRIEIAQATIALRRTAGEAAADEAVRGGKGKQVMDEIRQVVAEMREAEYQLLQRRTAELRANNERTLVIFMSLMGALAVLLAGGFFLVQRNIAAKQREIELTVKARAHAENIVDTVREPLLVLDAELRVRSANRSFYQTFRVTPRETEGKLLYDLGNGQWNIPELRELLEEVLPQNTKFHDFPVEHDFPEIGRRTMLLNARKMYRVGNNTDSILLAIEDTTERRRAEEERDRFFSVSLDLFCVAGFDGYFKRLNPAWKTTLGYTPEELLSRPYLDFVHPEDRESTAEAARQQIEEGRVILEFENRYRSKDGSYRWLSWRSLPAPDSELIYATARDVTEHKQAEEALRRAKEEAERTSRFKDQFLSTMSHELRTPLNAVLGFSELLEDERYGPLNERQRRYLNHIQNGGKHLLTLINDILDLSKIEAGRVELFLGDVPLRQLFHEVQAALRPLADKKSHSFSVSDDASLVVRADPTRLRQVLTNLLANAVKFTPAGGRIELAARAENGAACIEVRDNGPGIPPEEQHRIFEAFYRMKNSGQSAEGTGLGLAITQRLVELQGGRLNVESRPGEGSRFFFSLPVTSAASAGRRAIAATMAGPRILVVENDTLAAELIRSQLRPHGYEVETCVDPQSVLERAAAMQPHAITLDVLMEPLNGFEVLLQLKSDARTSPIPVIVLTVVEQPNVGFALGADEYLVKPVEKSVLLAAVQRCLRKRALPTPQRPILVVEDDAPMREAIADMLVASGFAVAPVADGAAAREWVRQSLPEVVILDLLLPEVSGFELLAEWRSTPRTADLPVFVLTAKDLTREEERQLRDQAEYLLRKQQPWQETLLQQLRRIAPPNAKERA